MCHLIVLWATRGLQMKVMQYVYVLRDLWYLFSEFFVLCVVCCLSMYGLVAFLE